VYDCQWGLETVRVIVAGELTREPHNAPLHLFSASPELVGFGRGAYRRRSERTSRLLGQLFERMRAEGFAMSYTMADFDRDYFAEHFAKLTPEEQGEVLERLPAGRRRAVLESLPAEVRLAGLTADEIRRYLDRLTAGRTTEPRKPRRKK
jgi:hypothetical protein